MTNWIERLARLLRGPIIGNEPEECQQHVGGDIEAPKAPETVAQVEPDEKEVAADIAAMVAAVTPVACIAQSLSVRYGKKYTTGLIYGIMERHHISSPRAVCAEYRAGYRRMIEHWLGDGVSLDWIAKTMTDDGVPTSVRTVRRMLVDWGMAGPRVLKHGQYARPTLSDDAARRIVYGILVRRGSLDAACAALSDAGAPVSKAGLCKRLARWKRDDWDRAVAEHAEREALA